VERMLESAKTILHIEDNSDNRMLIRRILQFEGYQVLEAENARSAMSLLAVYRPDLILMDINMPDEDGYTLTQKLKLIPALIHVPILAITANALKGDKEKSLQAGCDGYIEKPIDIDDLLEQLAHYLN
jgi:two-component system cell cycle response regulator DivK